MVVEGQPWVEVEEAVAVAELLVEQVLTVVARLLAEVAAAQHWLLAVLPALHSPPALVLLPALPGLLTPNPSTHLYGKKEQESALRFSMTVSYPLLGERRVNVVCGGGRGSNWGDKGREEMGRGEGGLEGGRT